MKQSNPTVRTSHPCSMRLRSTILFLAVMAITTVALLQHGGRIVEADTSIGNVPAGLVPIAVGVNPITNKIYIANSSSNNVTVIDGTNNSPVTVAAGADPRAIAVNPTTNKIYVANADSNNVTVIDGTNESTVTVASGAQPQDVAINAVTNKIYVANGGGGGAGNVMVIDGINNSTVAVAAGFGPHHLAVNPVTNKIYVLNSTDNVTVIDGTNNSTVTVAVGSTPRSVAINPVTNKIYVANIISNNVTVIDGSNNSTTTVAVGTFPSLVAVNPVTNRIYVNSNTANVTVIDGTNNSPTAFATASSIGSFAVNPLTNKIYGCGGGNADVTVIDGTNNSFTTIAADTGPADLAVNAVTNRIYVANSGSNNVTVIDGSYNTTATVAAGTEPLFVAVNPVTNKTYATNFSSANVTVIDGANNSTTVAVGTSPAGVEVNPVTNKIYVSNAGSNDVTVIDGTNNSTTTVAAGLTPAFIAVNPVTNKIYVVNIASNTVTVIDGTNNSTTAVSVGSNPSEIDVNPVTNKVYVANRDSNNVTVIDGSDNSTITVAAGTEPRDIAVNPVTNKIYVANQSSSNVTVIDGGNNSTITVAAGAEPKAVVVNPVTNKIYVANGSGNNVTVIDGSNNSTTTVATGMGPTDHSLAVNPATNKIYVANFSSANITIIDGTNNSTTTVTEGAGLSNVAVNQVTNKIYVANEDSSNVTVITPAPTNAIPLNTAVTPLAGNTTSSTTPTLTLTATSTYSPTAPPPQHIYFQMDTANGAWTKATNTGNTSTTVTANATPTSLQPGVHIMYFFATDGSDATSINPRNGEAPESSSVIGGINAYLFLVAPGFDPCAPTPIAYGQTITGGLNSGSCVLAGPTDQYTFSGTAGEQIAISMDAVATGSVQPSLELANVGGTVIVASDSGLTNARIPVGSGFFTLPSSDIYYIRAATSAGNFGEYVLSLSQQPGGACNYTATPSVTNVSPAGGTFLFHVLTGAGCPTVSAATGPNSSHILIVSNIGGQITFSVDPHVGTEERAGTIIAGGQTHTVTQLGMAAPLNDFFGQSQPIGGASGSITGHNINATAEPGEPAHAGVAAAHSVWYRWTAPDTGLFSFTTTGSSFDTRIGIYTGSTVSSLTEVVSNDNSAEFDLTSRVVFHADQNTEYFIAVDGSNDSMGAVNLIWRQAARTYRIYAQTGNGNTSPRIPIIIATRTSDGTQYPATPLSPGVFELDLPVDNATYIVNITGPDIWSPNTFTLDNSSRSEEAEDRQSESPTTGGFNLVTVAKTISATVIGQLEGLSSTNGVTVFLGSESGPNPIPPIPCEVSINANSQVLYICQFIVDTLHQIKPSLNGVIFEPLNRRYLAPVVQNILPGPGSRFIAEGGQTYSISGLVTANGAPALEATVFLTGSKTHSYFTAADGAYQFNSLPAGGDYTISVAFAGFTFVPQTVTDLQSNQVINMAAQGGCTYSLSSPSMSIPAAGGEQTFTIDTQNGCPWQVSNPVSWITVNLGSGNGPGPIYFTALANVGMPRTATLQVAGQSITVDQANGCTFSAAPVGSTTFPAPGGTGSFEVTASDGACILTPTANDYCMIDPGGSTTGNTPVNFTVSENRGVARNAVINVGGHAFTLTQDAAPGTHRARFDFDGDGRSDISVFRPSEGSWYLLNSAGFTALQFGTNGDIPVAADYDGDGKADIAVFRPFDGFWYRIESSTQEFIPFPFGQAGDIPVPADYDGDGRADIAVYRPSTGAWYLLQSTQGISAVQFGVAEDKPVAADYDGDGKADIAVFRPSTGVWYILNSASTFSAVQFGVAEDVPVPADYDRDGRADIAVYRPSNNFWYREDSSSGQFVALQFGLTGDKPVPGDYNGDKSADIAVFRPADGHWYLWSCTNNQLISATHFGVSTDIPIAYPITP